MTLKEAYCTNCGETKNITFDSTSRWCIETQALVHVEELDSNDCQNCGLENQVEFRDIPDEEPPQMSNGKITREWSMWAGRQFAGKS